MTDKNQLGFTRRVRRKIGRVHDGLESLGVLLLHSVDYALCRNPQRRLERTWAREEKKREALSKRYETDGAYRIKDARLPLMSPIVHSIFWAESFEDIFWIYLKHGDCYEESVMQACYDLLPEGNYCLKNDLVDVTVNSGDVVIDAGSWIGDFAAYASAKGAVTYAFEPSGNLYGYLSKTAELNPNIHPVKKGLGDVEATVRFTSDTDEGSGNKILGEAAQGEHFIQTTTIDAFVKETGLPRVDFIKADIEGYERHMLEGARKTLKDFAPKLAICTYHLPDDPEVLAGIIKDANPAYKIVQRRNKLYASI